VKNDDDLGAPSGSAEGASPLQLEPSKAARKRCQGVTRNGTACTAWAMQLAVPETTAPKKLLTNLSLL